MNNYNNNAATTNHVAPLAGLNVHPEPFVPVSQHSSATVHSTTDGVLGLLALHPAPDGRVDGLVKVHLHGDRPADARPVAVNYIQLYLMGWGLFIFSCYLLLSVC